MKKSTFLCLGVSAMLLSACGQQAATTPSPASAASSTQSSRLHRTIELQPASGLKDFLDTHPDIKQQLEQRGTLEEALSLSTDSSLKPQQTVSSSFCTVDYGTDVIADEYVGGQAVMNCDYPFNSSTYLQVVTRRDPDFGQIDGTAYGSFTPSTYLSVSTNGSFQNERGQQFCTNASAFIVLADGRYGSSPQGAYDCIQGY